MDIHISIEKEIDNNVINVKYRVRQNTDHQVFLSQCTRLLIYMKFNSIYINIDGRYLAVVALCKLHKQSPDTLCICASDGIHGTTLLMI